MRVHIVGMQNAKGADLCSRGGEPTDNNRNGSNCSPSNYHPFSLVLIGIIHFSMSAEETLTPCRGEIQELRDRVAQLEKDVAERSTRESEERFRLMADTAPVMMWMSGPDT